MQNDYITIDVEFEFYLTFSVFSIRKMVDRIECIALIGYKYFHCYENA